MIHYYSLVISIVSEQVCNFKTQCVCIVAIRTRICPIGFHDITQETDVT